MNDRAYRDAVTSYDDLRECILRALDRDGKHDWDETGRLADVIAPAVWNLVRACPIPPSE